MFAGNAQHMNEHLYNVGPTSKTLGRRCTNVIQMCLLGGALVPVTSIHMLDWNVGYYIPDKLGRQVPLALLGFPVISLVVFFSLISNQLIVDNIF